MTEFNTKSDAFDDDEITLKEIILKIKDYFQEIANNWKLVGLITFLFLFYMVYKSLKSDYTYQAKLTFMINQAEGSSMGGLGGLLGQFGIGEKDEANKNKIMMLNKSRRIIEKAMFEKVIINGRKDFIANHIIINLDTLGQWASVPFYLKPFAKENPLKGFRFKHGDTEKFDEIENAGLKSVYKVIAGNPDQGSNGIMTNGFDKESGIMYISTTTDNPELSIAVTNNVFDHLSKFYIEKTIEKQKFTYDVLKAKTDSIFALLQGKESGAAMIEDRNVAAWGSTTKLPERRYNRDIQKLTIIYGETLKNLEIADFAVKNQMPFVQPIDRPKLPIMGVKTSLVKSVLIGLFLGFFISFLYIIGRKIIREALSE